MHNLQFDDVSQETLHVIAARHGLEVDTCARLPQVGVINTIYALGDTYVLRVPRDHPGPIAQARAESLAAPAARAAGVRTPALIAYDGTCDLLPVPYLVYERVHGRTLGLLDWEPAAIPQVWRELGQDLAVLHRNVSLEGPAGALRTEEPPVLAVCLVCPPAVTAIPQGDLEPIGGRDRRCRCNTKARMLDMRSWCALSPGARSLSQKGEVRKRAPLGHRLTRRRKPNGTAACRESRRDRKTFTVPFCETRALW